ncbi:MAG: 2Fe-2S iron-sulfur cluster-binding protein [Patescibacteria group bacterium]|jgi:NADP-reducing hydrogenase subunit HndD|nr:2Fe-2S iron-sulfur cluster-binding protein [Patescibacteria group bacterium]
MKPKQVKKIKVIVDGRLYYGVENETIFQLLKRKGFDIPALCHHPDLKVKANCRICVVEVSGCETLKTSCSTKIESGMEIYTSSDRVIKARKINIELLYASHVEKCVNCSYRFECDLLKFARQYRLKINRFSDRKKNRKTYKFGKAVEIDDTQCIDCNNCVEACQLQGISFLKSDNYGINTEIKPVSDKDKTCVYCGQCALHCPVAAAQEQDSAILVDKMLKDKKKIVVAQIAPAVRVALGENFGFKYGVNVEDRIYTALKKLGFDYVFDVNFGADITTMVEAEELVERLSDKKAVWPMMTSCCPAWVNFVEFYHPELINNLTTARSPHIHNAAAIKTYFAKKKEINPKDIVVVSIMPCTAKKQEKEREELKYKGRKLVDEVLTTREFSYLIKDNKIDFNNLSKSEGREYFNSGSGAGAIYGASGGVMESALRSVPYILNKKEKEEKEQEEKEKGKNSKKKNKNGNIVKAENAKLEGSLEFKSVRGMKGIKEAEVKIGKKKLKLAIVSGLKNIESLIPKLSKYHYVEVMACPGGCIGGGGQPIPTTDEIVEKRMKGLYGIDKKREKRRAHLNKEMMECYQSLKNSENKDKLLHTKYKKSKRIVVKTTKDIPPF